MSDDAKAEAVVAEMNAAEDDFTHYFNATGRLSRENADLRARCAAVEAERDAAQRVANTEHRRAQQEYDRAEAAEARLAAVEAERDRLRGMLDAERAAVEAYRAAARGEGDRPAAPCICPAIGFYLPDCPAHGGEGDR